jgi:hypothetical protein
MDNITLTNQFNNYDFSNIPLIPKKTHPIETGRYLIATNEICNLYDTLNKWINNRVPGGIIYGKPRLGKTRAIEYLNRIIFATYNYKLAIYIIKCRHYKYPNEGIFFENFLRDINHGICSSGKPHEKRNRLINFLRERAEAYNTNRVIVFIDDAQELFEMQYGWLMDIYNELDSYRIFLTVILVGQEELIHQRSAFIESKKQQIIGRFMVHEYKFTGIKNIDDIKTCLRAYDLDSEYPENSGWSFTRYYFPEAFPQGNRLENCAEDLYCVFKNLRKEAKNLKSSFEIPMQYLTLTVEYALCTFGTGGENLEWLAQSHWKESVINSGYIESETHFISMDSGNQLC